MADTVKSKRVFEAGSELEFILYRICEGNMFEMFERYPINEIRMACLRKIKACFGPSYLSVGEFQINWAEDCICQLLAQGDDMWQNVLDWYLFAVNDRLIERAVSFTVGQVFNYREKSPDAHISKALTNRIKREGHTWKLADQVFQEGSSMLKYLEWCLDRLSKPRQYRITSQGYTDQDWVIARRALELIIMYPIQCLPVLPVLGMVIQGHERHGLVPVEKDPLPIFPETESSDPFAKIRCGENLRMLGFAQETLEKVRQTPV